MEPDHFRTTPSDIDFVNAPNLHKIPTEYLPCNCN